MDSLNHAVETLLHLVVQAGNLIVAGIIAIELWLRGQLAALGLPPAIQTVLLIALAALLIVAALRLFGGLIRVAVILVVILIAIHVLMPVFQT